jgi:integrase
VPLTSAFAAYLRVYQAGDHGYMLTSPRSHPGKRYRYNFRVKFDAYMARQCKVHGFPKLTAHDMRRTFASLIASSRATSMYELSRWLGDGLDVVIAHYGFLQPHDGSIDHAFRSRPAAQP